MFTKFCILVSLYTVTLKFCAVPDPPLEPETVYIPPVLFESYPFVILFIDIIEPFDKLVTDVFSLLTITS